MHLSTIYGQAAFMPGHLSSCAAPAPELISSHHDTGKRQYVGQPVDWLRRLGRTWRRPDVSMWRRCAAGVAAVPRGYAQVGHRKTGYTMGETRSAGGGGVLHETLMFTAEGAIFTKP